MFAARLVARTLQWSLLLPTAAVAVRHLLVAAVTRRVVHLVVLENLVQNIDSFFSE